MIKSSKEKLPPPRVVFLTVTDECNLRCKMCGVWMRKKIRDKDDNKHLEYREFINILNEIKWWGGVQYIAFDTIGEPFLNPSFIKLVRYANKLGFKTNTVTNGTLINESLAKDIIFSGLNSLLVSLDGPTAAIHDKIRGVRGSFDKVIKSIYYIHRLQKRYRIDSPAIGVMSVISKKNIDYIDVMADLLKKIGVNYIRFVYVSLVDRTVVKDIYLKVGRNIVNTKRFELSFPDLYIKEDQSIKLIKKIVCLEEKCRAYGIRLNFSLNIKGYHQECNMLWNSIFLDVFGNVYPCPMMDTGDWLGNVRYQLLDDIWNSQSYYILRQLIYKRNKKNIDIELCKRCCLFSEIKYHG
ncbi:MAG: radical SAM protein [Candidatus Omnitrophica bacterium]|nr:radical SAM protein [Candidatus Omnitrophota bacterium]